MREGHQASRVERLTDSHREPSRWRALAVFVIAGQTLLVLTTFLDYGITWDETWNLRYGRMVLDWYRSGFVEQDALTFWTMPYDGAFFNVLGLVVDRLLPLDTYSTGHLLDGLFGVVGSIFTWRLASRLGGPRAGFFGVLLLLTVPRWYGHAFANLRDFPMAVLAIVALDGIVRLLDYLPRPPFVRIAAVAVPTGLALAVRAGSIFLIGYAVLALLAWLACQRLTCPPGVAPPSLRFSLVAASRTLAILLGLTWISLAPWWPKALLNPLWPVQSFLYTTSDFAIDLPVLFEGIRHSNQDLPWYYVLKWFALVLPEHLMIGLTLAVGAAVSWTIHQRRAGLAEALPGVLRVGLVVVAAGLPLAHASTVGVPVYDGIRHYLFILPPLAVLAALGIDKVLTWVPTRFQRIVLAVLAAVTTVVVVDMVRLHPYQYIYFNRTVAGGLKGAFGQYDTEYWGASYKEGVEWLLASYHRPDLDRRIRVVSNSFTTSTEHYLPTDRFEYLGSDEDGGHVKADAPPPDIFLSTLRNNKHRARPGRVIHTVERMGVPLLYVIEVDQP